MRKYFTMFVVSKNPNEWVGNEYSSATTSYKQFDDFKNKLLSFITKGKFNDTIKAKKELLPITFENPYSHEICTDIEFVERELKEQTNISPRYSKELKEYYSLLSKIKKEMLKLYDCMGFLFHNEYEGLIPLEQVKSTLPHIIEYYEKSKLSEEEKTFVEEVIKCLEEVIKINGQILFP